MTQRSPLQPVLLSRLNERQVARALLKYGPSSRADLARFMGRTPPTVSKAVDSLLLSGHLEEIESASAFGRPAKRVTLASRHAQVLGLVIDAPSCRLVAAGMDGQIRSEDTCVFSTPDTYEELIRTAAEYARIAMRREGVTTLGMGISMPGLVDYRQKRGLLSPNIPLTNGQCPGVDLAERLGIECVLVQEEHALCLAERCFGSAQDLDDFAMLDVSTGVGLGVMSGGRFLMGRSGFAGEIGHITVDLHGRRCGCGNRGCLETVACDSALAWQVSQKLGRPITIDDLLDPKQKEILSFEDELEETIDYLSVGLAAVINLFNPQSLFVHGRIFDYEEGLFQRVVTGARERALTPSFNDCEVVQARGSKRQGTLAAIIEHLFDARVAMVGASEEDMVAAVS